MSENELRRLLAQALPEAPQVPDRYAAARRSATVRGRRRAIGSGFVVVALSVAAGLLVVRGSGSDAPGPADAPPKALSCQVPNMANDAWPWPDDSVPLGSKVTRAHLCVHSPEQSSQTPHEDLTVGVDQIARTIDRLRPAEKRRVCRGPGLRTFTIVFGNADGLTSVAWLNTQSCGAVVVDNVPVGDESSAAKVLDRYLDLLAAQRAALGAPAGAVGPTGLGCAGNGAAPAVMTGMGRSALSRAVGCAPGSDDPISLTGAEVAVFSREVLEPTSPGGSVSRACSTRSGPFRVVGTNIWGDRLVLEFHCQVGVGDYVVLRAARAGPRVWIPRPGARDLVDDLLRRRPPTP